MALSLLWLPDVLLDAGLEVATVDGWQLRGQSDVGRTLGILSHHTAGPREGNMPSLDTLVHGRPDSNGPLAQLGLGRDGTFYVIAAGLANHAGVGIWQGVTTGNTNFIGVEAENTGLDGDSPWPAVQIDAYQRGVAAILRHVGLGAQWCVGHKEFAPKRKIDPTLDMEDFRRAVGAILRHGAPTCADSKPRASWATWSGGGSRDSAARVHGRPRWELAGAFKDNSGWCIRWKHGSSRQSFSTHSSARSGWHRRT